MRKCHAVPAGGQLQSWRWVGSSAFVAILLTGTAVGSYYWRSAAPSEPVKLNPSGTAAPRPALRIEQETVTAPAAAPDLVGDEPVLPILPPMPAPPIADAVTEPETSPVVLAVNRDLPSPVSVPETPRSEMRLDELPQTPSPEPPARPAPAAPAISTATEPVETAAAVTLAPNPNRSRSTSHQSSAGCSTGTNAPTAASTPRPQARCGQASTEPRSSGRSMDWPRNACRFNPATSPWRALPPTRAARARRPGCRRSVAGRERQFAAGTSSCGSALAPGRSNGRSPDRTRRRFSPRKRVLQRNGGRNRRRQAVVGQRPRQVTTEHHRSCHVPFDAGDRDDDVVGRCAGNQA